MAWYLISQGRTYELIILLIVMVISLTFHEFGHAVTAKYFGDNTAASQGRVTLNPISHIDPLGLLMIAIIGFGYARPVPVNKNNFTSYWADLWVSAAGPGMNLLLAIVSINLLHFGTTMQWAVFSNPGFTYFLYFSAIINMVLMVFNLIPLGPLDGHYIFPYFLSRKHAAIYEELNSRFGNMIFFALVIMSLMGVPIFSYVWILGENLANAVSVFNWFS